MSNVNSLIEKINTDLAELRKLLNEEQTSKQAPEIYSLYHGDELIRIGTLKELSEFTMFSEGTLKNYSYPSHIEKTKGTNAPRVFLVNRT